MNANMCARILLFLFLLQCLYLVLCKRFETRCLMVQSIMEVGVPIELFLGQWVCLIEQVSNRDTSKVTTSGGRKSYGLFQIPSRWCREGKKGGECNVACESLIDEDIYDDTVCAVQIFNREGFKYWPLWVSRCKNKVDAITADIFKCPGLSMRMGLDSMYSLNPVITQGPHKSRQRRWIDHFKGIISGIQI